MSNPTSNLLKTLHKIIGRLAYHIEKIHHPDALACALWLIGQYAGEQDASTTEASVVSGVANWAPDVLRKMAKGFSNEVCHSRFSTGSSLNNIQCTAVKLQIIILAAKLRILNHKHGSLEALSRYVFSLARYDGDYDVRDRARMLSSLLLGLSTDSQTLAHGGVVLRPQQIKTVLFLEKLYLAENETSEGSDLVYYDYQKLIQYQLASDSNILGSLGPLLGQAFFDTNISPNWLEQGTEKTLRDTEVCPPIYNCLTLLTSSL